jgi:excisionase family DNA binding protein
MHRDRRPVVPIPSDWMTKPQAAVYMGCTKSYVDTICRKGKIPFSKAGRRYILSKRDCDAHLEQIKRLPASDADAPI